MFVPKITPELLRSTRSDYTKKTATRSLFVEAYNRKGELISLYMNPQMLTADNSKLGEGVLSFDLPAVLTCPNCSDCRKGCYARKIEKLRPNVFDKHVLNFFLVQNNPSMAFNLIYYQIITSEQNIIRLHSSGDFFSQKYVDLWAEIIEALPQKQFYTYTKTRDIFDFSKLDKLDNFNIVESVLPDGSINFGDKAYIEEKKKKYPVIPICPVTQKIDGVRCMRECKHCLTCESVMFEKH